MNQTQSPNQASATELIFLFIPFTFWYLATFVEGITYAKAGILGGFLVALVCAPQTYVVTSALKHDGTKYFQASRWRRLFVLPCAAIVAAHALVLRSYTLDMFHIPSSLSNINGVGTAITLIICYRATRAALDGLKFSGPQLVVAEGPSSP